LSILSTIDDRIEHARAQGLEVLEIRIGPHGYNRLCEQLNSHKRFTLEWPPTIREIPIHIKYNDNKLEVITK